jgi:modulator of FtsH protease HflK
MAWNKPGNNGDQQDPWGGGKNQGPPDLGKIFGQFVKKLQSWVSFGNKGKMSWQPSPAGEISFSLGLFVLIVIIVWFLFGFYIVNPAEQAVVLRFGKFVQVQDPGLHWMARFINTKYTVDVQKVYSFSLQGEFLTKSSEQSDLPNQVIPVSNPGAASVDSTDKSKNLVNVELNVQYRINDPRAYLFNVANPDDTIQEVTAGALSDVIGKMKLDDVLTTGREWLSSGVLEQLKQVLASYNTGLEVVAVTPRRVQAPDQVRAAFNDVNRADQDRATYIQQAQAYASKVVPLARGEAARISADANAYKQQVVLAAQAQISRYQSYLSVYQTSPELTRNRMYLETMQTIFTNTSKVLVDLNASNNILYLPMDKLMQTVRQENPSMLSIPEEVK